jgi:GAF domain-containing protein
MQCPACQQDNPAHAKFCPECGAPVTGVASIVRPHAGLQDENEALRRSLTQALEQQAATAEILNVISRSPADLQPVLEAVAQNASGLCGAANVSLYRVDGDLMRKVAEAEQGQSLTALRIGETRPITRTSVSGRAIVDRTTIHLADHQSAEAVQEYPDARHDTGIRTTIGIPLLRDGIAIGAFTAYRTEFRPFSEREIALLRVFADQAVIAIENVRLFNETKAALERQTASSEILRVIGSSPTDVQPVFETIARSGVSVCAALGCAVFIVDGDMLRVAATHGVRPERLERFRQEYPAPLDAKIDSAQTIRERRVFHLADIEHNPDASASDIENARLAGYQSRLMVPMVRGDRALGLIAVTRQAPTPFSDQQVELLKTFADQAVIAIENVRLFTELQASNRDLTTALDKQTATSEILRVISTSPADAQPVFDAIVRSAVRLLSGSLSAAVSLLQGEELDLTAITSTNPAGDEAIRRLFPMALDHIPFVGRVVRNRRPDFIRDVDADARVSSELKSIAHERGWRSCLWVPMIHGDTASGVISVTRQNPGSFAEEEITLLQTFADQAVIAIENVRLFTELDEKNRALTEAHAQVTEALEQQTATSEILRVISSSPTALEPVAQTIADSAGRLCNCAYSAVFRFDGELIHWLAARGVSGVQVEALRGVWPRVPDRETLVGRTILARETLHFHDAASDPTHAASLPTARAALAIRSWLGVPIVREGEPIGVIALVRLEVRPFSEQEIALVQTFADQAVIAIENVRLFTELQASNRDLTTALDKQTATSDILRVISQSQADVQPVFDAIVSSAVRLLRAYTGTLTRIAGDQIELAALASTDESADALTRALFPRSLHSEGLHVRAIRDRAPINVVDYETDPRWSVVQRARTRARGYRSWAVVPLLQHDDVIGTIAVTRREPGGFTDDEIALLQTFADQAVIAIENVRLVTELRERTGELTRSVEQLTALGEVGRAVSSTLDLETVLTTIVSRAVELSGLDGGVVFEYDEAAEEFVQRVATETGGPLAETRRNTRFRKGEGVLGQTAITLEPVQVPDITVPGAYESRLRENLIASGIRAILAVPMVREDRLIGCLAVTRNHPGRFPTGTIELLRTFATQSALAIQNARLFREIADKSRQLEVASQHKSEFLANMSHELRTPLNAIIGFSEVLTDRMFGELNEKQEEYLKDIHASGTHLLSLINDILDLSKIEAGRMELELTEFDLPTALDNALTLVRERAARRGIALHTNVDERLGQIQADERKIRQVVLNLLSNAIKFTPEGGRIEVAALPTDGSLEISVSDTGVGIAPEDQQAVFEEFRQVGTAEKKAEGTGLGLALCRKFVELHGGRIWVKSQVGAGSTFTFTIPVHRGE